MTNTRPNAPDAKTCLQMAHMMFTGRAAPRFPGEPIRLVEEACAQKSAEALMYHAALAARGHGRPQNFEDAFKYLTEAAALGDTRARGQLVAMDNKFDRDVWFGSAPATQHHAAPRVFTIENFLPKPVCAWLIKQSKKNLQRAPVQDAGNGGVFSVDSARSNSVAGSNALQPDLVMQLTNLRIAAAIGMPLANQEPTNVLHYARGQEYKAHYDFFRQDEEAGFAHELRTIGQRAATVLVYLNEGYEGGETDFPKLNWRFKGKTGDALIFWNLSAEGVREKNSLHSGMPILKGEKWLLSKWVRQRAVPLI